MAVATFNYAAWIARYPEFATVGQTLAQAYFDEATVYHANDGTGPVTDAARQLTLLNTLTAHIAALNWAGSAQATSGLVGAISHASEGSVSVEAKFADGVTPSMAWFLQTKYGAAYWQMTAPYRTFRYAPAPASAYGFGRFFRRW